MKERTFHSGTAMPEGLAGSEDKGGSMGIRQELPEREHEVP